MDNVNQTAEIEQVQPAVEATPEDTSPVSERENQPVETQSETPSTSQLPDEKSEQGRAFQEMRHKIRKLEDQVKANRSAPDNQPASVLSHMQLNSTNPDVAREVRQVLSEQKAWDKYPQLNPQSDKYDAKFARRITKLAAMDIVERGEADIYSIAEEEAALYYRPQEIEKVKKETETKVKEQLTEKEQAALTVTGNPPAKSKDQTDMEQLVYLSRHGTEEQKVWARAERLKRAGV